MVFPAYHPSASPTPSTSPFFAFLLLIVNELGTAHQKKHSIAVNKKALALESTQSW